MLPSSCGFSLADWAPVDAGATVPGPHSDAAFVWVRRVGGFRGPVLLLLRGVSSADNYVLVFDVARRRWARRVQMPVGVGQRGLLTGAYEDRYAFVVGGTSGARCAGGGCCLSRRGWLLDLETWAWRPLPDLPQPLAWGAALVSGAAFHVFGGVTGGDAVETTGAHYAMDLGRGVPQPRKPRWSALRWVPQPPLPAPAAHMAAVAVGPQWYVIGGESGPRRPCSRPFDPSEHAAEGPACAVPHVWVYHAALRMWRRTADLPIPTSRAEGQALRIGRYVAVFGGAQTGESIHGSVQVYDAATERWAVLNQTLRRPLTGAVMWTARTAAGALALHGHPRGGRTAPGATVADTMMAKVRQDLPSPALRPAPLCGHGVVPGGPCGCGAARPSAPAPPPPPRRPRVKPSNASEAEVLAFYFPQFHADPLNDALWGPNFTDWDALRRRSANRHSDTLLTPSALGYYDLLSPGTRRQQAALAKRYGVGGFVYHHSWVYGNGTPVLARPLQQLLRDGEPNLRFAFHWANRPWTQTWQGITPGADRGDLLVNQSYPRTQAALREHYAFLRPFFRHRNYIKVHGAPLFLMTDTAGRPPAWQRGWCALQGWTASPGCTSPSGSATNGCCGTSCQRYGPRSPRRFIIRSRSTSSRPWCCPRSMAPACASRAQHIHAVRQQPPSCRGGCGDLEAPPGGV